MIESDKDLEGPGESPAALDKTTILADVLKERGPLPEPELLKTFLEVLRDLDRAHGYGTLHCDISPARIVFNGAGWKLADYGLASVGTVRYMSPERCQGKPTDARSDIYSLGVVLFEAATGTVPFDAEMKFQIMEDHAETPPPSPRAVNPAVSEELDRVILRALAKDPADRFQTAAEFKQALEAMLPESDRPLESSTEPTAETVAETMADTIVEPVVSGSAEDHYSSAYADSWAEPVEVAPTETWSAPRRIKLAPILIPLAAAIVAIVGLLLLTGVIGGRRVPLVTGMSSEEAGQLLRLKGFRVETDPLDDTLPVGIVVTQAPEAGANGPRSRAVELGVSTGKVAMPSLAGLALPDARARLARLALTSAKVDSQYSDDYPADVVVSSKLTAGAKVAPHTGVNLTVSGGRATCPQCGTRREARAKFCTKCGFKF
jgi:eukaryotic-like serine/threonine-protein kinase